jgi:hypothetical protein
MFHHLLVAHHWGRLVAGWRDTYEPRLCAAQPSEPYRREYLTVPLGQRFLRTQSSRFSVNQASFGLPMLSVVVLSRLASFLPRGELG